jgi:adenylate cyclase
VFTVSYVENGVTKRFDVPPGETLVGRAPSCGLVLTDPSVSRQHVSLLFRDERLLVRDVGSRFGTFKNGGRVTDSTELAAGDALVLGSLPLQIGRIDPGVSFDDHHIINDLHTVFRPVVVAPIVAGDADAPPGDAARLLALLSEIGRTLVLVQPLQQVLGKIVDLTFGSVPAERAFLMLRDISGELAPKVARNRDGLRLSGARISRTVVDKVLRERVAMLALDTAVDPRLAGALSIQAATVRSFMCAPLWNRNEVIGVLYVDNPSTKQFSAADLDVFAALSNYAAVAIEQARLSDELLDETKRRERLQRYHSPGVVNRILGAGESPEGQVAAQVRDVSVMFADIVEFTALSQRMTPGDLVTLLSSFFELVTDIIFEYDGTLDKFIGDCVMAVFGAPFDQPDHARRCVATAREIRRALIAFNQQIAPESLQLRIAINSGEAMVGDVGSSKRREFAVLGDVVNAASRIERLARPGQILLSKATYERAGADLQANALGSVAIRGQQEQIELYELVD